MTQSHLLRAKHARLVDSIDYKYSSELDANSVLFRYNLIYSLISRCDTPKNNHINEKIEIFHHLYCMKKTYQKIIRKKE